MESFYIVVRHHEKVRLCIRKEECGFQIKKRGKSNLRFSQGECNLSINKPIFQLRYTNSWCYSTMKSIKMHMSSAPVTAWNP